MRTNADADPNLMIPRTAYRLLAERERELRTALEDVLDGWTVVVETDDTTDFEAALGRARATLAPEREHS